MFWPFRLLIATLIAMVSLTLILSAVAYFENLRVQVSRERMAKAFDNAWGAITTPSKPEKGLKLEEQLTIPETTIGNKFFADRFNLKQECVKFQAVENSAFKLSPNGNSVKVEKQVAVNVYFLCVYRNQPDCPETCYISFGKKPEIT